MYALTLPVPAVSGELKHFLEGPEPFLGLLKDFSVVLTVFLGAIKDFFWVTNRFLC